MNLDEKINLLDFPYIRYSYPFDKSKIKKISKNFKPTIYEDVPNNLKNKCFEKICNKYFYNC